MSTTTSNLGLFKYDTSTDGNIAFSIDQALNNNWDIIDTNWNQGSSRNIGEIVASTIPLTDAGLHLLDGALISGSGIYSEFVTYIASLVNTYPDLFDTESNWQSSVAAYGVCGKFVYNSTNNTIRLPKITGFTEGTIDPTTLGDLTEAGLPNVTDETGGAFYNNSASNTTATNPIGQYLSTTYKIGGTASNLSASKLVLNLSKGNSIYGNSTTVQPQTIKVLYYIVISTSTKTQIQVDIDEIATDLNGKADVDLTNLNNAGSIVGAGLAMPSDTYDTLTIGASGTTYTAPANGWFAAVGHASASNAGIGLFTSNNLGSTASLQGFVAGMANIPVKKGESVELRYNSAPYSFRFIYAVGSESEA